MTGRLAIAVAGALAVPILVASLELPRAALTSGPTAWLQAVAHSAGLAYSQLFASVAYQLGVIAWEWGAARWSMKRHLRWAGHVALAAAVSTAVYRTLVRYEQFASYPPFVGAVVLLFVFLAVSGCALVVPSDDEPRRHKLARVVIVSAAVVGAAAATVLNPRLFKNTYPTLHLAMQLGAHLLLFVALAHTALAVRRAASGRVRASFAAAAALLLGVAPIVSCSGLIDGTRPRVVAYTSLGKTVPVFRPYTGEAEKPFGATVHPDLDGVVRFERRSGLPRLPAGFRLGDHDVLLITIEAARFDKTSLSNPRLGTTPRLLGLVEAGAFSFSRAYSPSSGTLASMASVFAMTYPSMTRFETWMKSWHGKLRNEERTVAELLTEVGYDTFWVGHDYNYGFSDNLLGLEQGFAERALTPERHARDARTLDARIADAAIERLARQPEDRRFFGWVFFASPHASYVAHYDDMPARSDHDRYLQEVRYADEQLGRVLEALRRSKRLERTVVIVAGDHGEEFGEHGGEKHKTTVFTESIHVPLVVWAPGVRGRVLSEPTSLMYVFPWLLLRSDGVALEAARARLTEHLGPMLAATDGGVVVELIGQDRTLASLVYADRKVNYDFIAGLYEAFDLEADPYEQEDLLLVAPSKARGLRERMDAYRNVRAALRRFVLLPEHPSVPRRPR